MKCASCKKVRVRFRGNRCARCGDKIVKAAIRLIKRERSGAR